MSSKITFSLWDKENNVLYTGGAVRIFEGADCTGTKVASTEAGEIIGDVVEIFETSGLYYVTGLDTAVYSMSLNAQPLVNLTNIILVGIDLVTHLANADIHSELDDTETSSDTKIWSINQIKTKIAEISGYAPDDISIQLNVDDELEVKAINGSIITDASIPAAKLATDSVETAKIKDANITVAKINYDTNDFEADGTKLSIKQSFSNETFINEDKSLNENLNNINNALVKHNTALNNTGNNLDAFHYNTIYNEDVAVASGVSGNEASFNYTEYNREDMAAGTSNIVIFQYIKQTGDLGIKVSFQYKYHTAGSEIELDTTNVGTCGWATPSGTQDVWTDTFIESTNRFEGASVGQELGFQLQLKSGPGQYIYVTRVKIDIISKNNSEI